MKNLKNKFRIASIAIAVVITISFMPAAKAGDDNGKFPVNVKFIGAQNDAPVYQFSFTNQKEEEFTITVSDKYNVIYTETVKGVGLVRKFQLVKNNLYDNTDDNEVVVEIKNTTTSNVINYRINPTAYPQTKSETASL